MSSPAVTHRLRAGLGVLLSTALLVGLGSLLLDGAHRRETASRARREAVIDLQALVDLVERAGISGDPVRKAVEAWQGTGRRREGVRVVVFDGLSLEASTVPADTGEKAAPRRLAREEKDVYDRGQRLRAAVETNRQEGGARKDEIEVETLANGGLSMAAPLQKDGDVVGMVEVETQKVPPARRAGRFAGTVLVLVPLVVFGVLAAVVGERRGILIALAAVLFAAVVYRFGGTAREALVAERLESETAIGKTVAATAEASRSVIAALGLRAEPAADPAAWDCDAFRRPLGFVTASGTLNESKLTPELELVRRGARRALAGIVVLSFVLLVFFASGGAAKLKEVLVDNRQAYAYTAPALIGMAVLVFFPFLYGIVLSFTDSNIYNSAKSIPDIWVGLRNYIEVLSDFSIAKTGVDGSVVFNYLNFYWTLFVTIVWTIANVTFGVTVGLALALILNTKGLALRPIYRVLLILPWAMPNYITALIWKGMFHQQFGVVNQVIQMAGGSAVSWFQTPFTSFLTALATNGWLSFPFMMVVSLGALQSIPGDLYEAARVDGASRWQQFVSITLPSLKPALVPAIILSVVWTFNMFNIVYLVTQGEPGGSTEILITQAYKFAFEKYRYGYAAAYSTVIFLILLAYGTFQNRMSRATEA